MGRRQGHGKQAVQVTRLMARVRARRLSDDHIKGNSVNTFLCMNGNVNGSVKVKLTRRGKAGLHSHQPACWLHLIFPTKNTASSLAHNTTSVDVHSRNGEKMKGDSWKLAWSQLRDRGEVNSFLCVSMCSFQLSPGHSSYTAFLFMTKLGNVCFLDPANPFLLSFLE